MVNLDLGGGVDETEATIHELQGVRMVRTVGVTLFGFWGECLSSLSTL